MLFSDLPPSCALRPLGATSEDLLKRHSKQYQIPTAYEPRLIGTTSPLFKVVGIIPERRLLSCHHARSKTVDCCHAVTRDAIENAPETSTLVSSAPASRLSGNGGGGVRTIAAAAAVTTSTEAPPQTSLQRKRGRGCAILRRKFVKSSQHYAAAPAIVTVATANWKAASAATDAGTATSLAAVAARPTLLLLL